MSNAKAIGYMRPKLSDFYEDYCKRLAKFGPQTDRTRPPSRVASEIAMPQIELEDLHTFIVSLKREEIQEGSRRRQSWIPSAVHRLVTTPG